MPKPKPDYEAADGDLISIPALAKLTDRDPQVIRRFIRQGRLKAVPHPNHAQALLVPWDQIAVLMALPRQGRPTKRTTVTLPDGSERTLTYVPGKKK